MREHTHWCLRLLSLPLPSTETLCPCGSRPRSLFMYTVAYMDLDTPNITVGTLSHRRKRFLVNYILFHHYYDCLRVELFSSISHQHLRRRQFFFPE